ncbi:hypothetical protein A3C23_01215 [Candidatus Roizmanbacteria bacterium RIFCSPHIGHO2_02_FULL_37_13b]|uniref:Thioredoxin domain-containing protein n=1 Tax=Candidatus Roizmanbacteria bacterium RIFCSPLOWO2_02_FULL_36_11 TaxID=1802071 RepID=A0A1F7JHE9_9BACT|nr:MAG: hypothetical protein A3C23_01215 [Candidatus Roizmanbacteria bacterium RIFCSPHIGHO2_02_FULL_37_13b]OGK55041.1 MAG: hypothetical protein A3H78_01020 [Candidatus Roizmanbacteria bacterium RIFCSPLOWO2_02_FULL_36_11]
MSEQKKLPVSSNSIIIVMLIGAAFLIGSLWSKVNYLEKSGTGAAPGADSQPVAKAPDTVAKPDTPQKAAKKPVLTSDDHVRGNKNAKVALVNYSDTECPFCARFHPTMQQVIKEYDGKVKWIYRHFPLSFHANAQKEAEATECAAKLGGNDAFWSYTDKIYERTTSNGTGFALDKLVPLAKEIGLNESQFKKCLDSDEFAQKVKDQMAKGTEEGVSGTPGTIIMDSKGDTQFINGALPYDQIKPMIDSVLK